jgi:hypothetical protein
VELSGPEGGPLQLQNLTDEELERQFDELLETLNLQKCPESLRG